MANLHDNLKTNMAAIVNKGYWPGVANAKARARINASTRKRKKKKILARVFVLMLVSAPFSCLEISAVMLALCLRMCVRR